MVHGAGRAGGRGPRGGRHGVTRFGIRGGGRRGGAGNRVGGRGWGGAVTRGGGGRGVRVGGSIEVRGTRGVGGAADGADRYERAGRVGEIDVGGIEVGNGADEVAPGGSSSTGRQIRGGGGRGTGNRVGGRGGGVAGARGVRVGGSIEVSGTRSGVLRAADGADRYERAGRVGEIDVGGIEVGNGASEVAPGGSSSTGRRRNVNKAVDESAKLLAEFANAIVMGNRELQSKFAGKLIKLGDIWVTTFDELQAFNNFVNLHNFKGKLRIPRYLGPTIQNRLREIAIEGLGISGDRVVMR